MYTIKSTSVSNLKLANIFGTDKAIIVAIGGKPQAISDNREGTIREEVRSAEQGERLDPLTRLNEQ